MRETDWNLLPKRIAQLGTPLFSLAESDPHVVALDVEHGGDCHLPLLIHGAADVEDKRNLAALPLVSNQSRPIRLPSQWRELQPTSRTGGPPVRIAPGRVAPRRDRRIAPADSSPETGVVTGYCEESKAKSILFLCTFGILQFQVANTTDF